MLGQHNIGSAPSKLEILVFKERKDFGINYEVLGKAFVGYRHKRGHY